MRSGFWSPLWSGSWSVRALCLWLSIVLLLLPSPIFAQIQSGRLDSIEQRLQNIVICSAQLDNELKDSQNLSQQRQQIISDQLIELADLKLELENWKASDEQKAKRIIELLAIIEKLEKKLRELYESCENIARPLREALQVTEKEIRRQKIEKWTLAILAGVVAGYSGYRIGKALR